MEFRKILKVCDIKWIFKVCVFLILIVLLLQGLDYLRADVLKGSLELDQPSDVLKQLDVEERQRLKQDILFRKIN